MQTLSEIKSKVTRLAQVLGASNNDLPTYGHSRDFGCPHVEVDDKCYHYVVVERGQEIARQSTSDLDELLFWIFADTTHNLAFSYKWNNRVEDEDCRRAAFPKQVELLALISLKMATRQTLAIEEILRIAPYDDEPTRAVNRMRKA